MSFYPKISYPIGGKLVQGGLPTAILNNLQFNAVTNEWEFVAAVAVALGDLEFLRDTELLGDIIKSIGVRSTVGVITLIIPAAGKTFFFLSASLSPNSMTATAAIAEIRNNGVIKDTMNIKWGTATDTATHTISDSSHQRIDSLVGDGILAYDVNINVVGLANPLRATLEGWIQNT